MLLIMNINKPTYEYPKHVIDKKIHAFMKVYILGKFQCISQINSSIDDALFFYFDITLRDF